MATMLNAPDASPIRVISKETIKAAVPSKTRRLELTPWDLALLSIDYIQKGHLFSNPTGADVKSVLARLKASLALSLVHFFPLSGRLATTASGDGEGSFIYLDCSDQGAEFVHAIADGVTLEDVLATGRNVPHRLIRRFFPMDSAVSHDGHTEPLLSIQVTELVDGIFLGCSFNHIVGDGTSFWHFFNTWAEICRDHNGEEVGVAEDNINFVNNIRISRPPIHDRFFLDGRVSPIRVPFHPDEFLKTLRTRSPPVELREKVFHFSKEAMAALKARANRSEYCLAGDTDPTTIISSLQSLTALLWRAITRARRFPENQLITTCYMAADDRKRLQPRLSEDYFGNTVNAPSATTTAGELVNGDLRSVALLLNRAIASHTDQTIRDGLERWTAAPVVHNHQDLFKPFVIMVSSSPRFDMYGCDFGWGKAVAVRSGPANKYDGTLVAYPGREGCGSVDMEVSLAPETISELESDEEFIAAVSSPPTYPC